MEVSNTMGLHSIAPMVIQPMQETEQDMSVMSLQQTERSGSVPVLPDHEVVQPGAVYQLINMNINGVVKNLMVPVQQQMTGDGTSEANSTKSTVVSSRNGVSILKNLCSQPPVQSNRVPIIIRQGIPLIRPSMATAKVVTNNMSLSKVIIPTSEPRGAIVIQKPKPVQPMFIRTISPPPSVFKTPNLPTNRLKVKQPLKHQTIKPPEGNKTINGSKTVNLSSNPPSSSSSTIIIVNNTGQVVSSSGPKSPATLGSIPTISVSGYNSINTMTKGVNANLNTRTVTLAAPTRNTMPPVFTKNPLGRQVYLSDKTLPGVSVDVSNGSPVLTLTQEAHETLLKETKWNKTVFVELSKYKSASGKNCAIVFNRAGTALKSYLIELNGNSLIPAKVATPCNTISNTLGSSFASMYSKPLQSILNDTPLKINSVYSLSGNEKTKDTFASSNSSPKNINNETGNTKFALNEIVKIKQEENDKLISDDDTSTCSEDGTQDYDSDYDHRFNRVIHDPDVRPRYGLSTSSLSHLPALLTLSEKKEKKYVKKEKEKLDDLYKDNFDYLPKRNPDSVGQRRIAVKKACSCLGCSSFTRPPVKKKRRKESKDGKDYCEDINKTSVKLDPDILAKYKSQFPMIKECKVVLYKMKVGKSKKRKVKSRRVAKKSTTKLHKGFTIVSHTSPLLSSPKGDSTFDTVQPLKTILPVKTNDSFALNTSLGSMELNKSPNHKSKYLMVKTNAGTFLVPTNNDEPAMMINSASNNSEGHVTAKVIGNSSNPTMYGGLAENMQLKIKTNPNISTNNLPIINTLLQGSPKTGSDVGILIENLVKNRHSNDVNQVMDRDEIKIYDNSISDVKAESTSEKIKRLKEKLKTQQEAMGDAKKAVENSKYILLNIDMD